MRVECQCLNNQFNGHAWGGGLMEKQQEIQGGGLGYPSTHIAPIALISGCVNVETFRVIYVWWKSLRSFLKETKGGGLNRISI